MKISLVVLAGGLGSRYKGQKQIDAVSKQNESLMEFALFDAVKLGITKVVFIINDQFPEDYKDYLVNVLKKKNCSAYFVEQTLTKYIPEEFEEKLAERQKPLGTAHAVFCGKDIIREPFITMNADDFYGFESFSTAVRAIQENKIDAENYASLTFKLKNTLSNNGSVSRGICTVKNGNLLEVEEFTNIENTSEGPQGFNELLQKEKLDADAAVSMNFWVLHPSYFEWAEKDLNEFLEDHADLSSKEFYLPSVIDRALKAGEIKVKALPTAAQWFGLTYKGDKEFVSSAIEKLKEQQIYPEKLWE